MQKQSPVSQQPAEEREGGRKGRGGGGEPRGSGWCTGGQEWCKTTAGGSLLSKRLHSRLKEDVVGAVVVVAAVGRVEGRGREGDVTSLNSVGNS